MKKIQKLIIFVLLLLVNISTTKAGSIDIFDKGWETEERYSSEAFDPPMVARGAIQHKEGYLIYEIDADEYYTTGEVTGMLSIYDTKGSEIKSVTFPNKFVISAIEYNDYYYVIKSDAKGRDYYSEETNTWIAKYDSNLNQIKEIKTSISLMFLVEYKFFENIDLINVYDNKINALTLDIANNKIYLLSYDLNLEKENIMIIQTDEDQDMMFEIFNNIKYINEKIQINENESIYYYGMTQKDNLTIKTGSYTIDDEENDISEEKGLIQLYKGEELVLEKKYDQFEHIVNPFIIQNYIIAKAYVKDDGSTSVLILDLEGNIVQRINSMLIGVMSHNDNSFIFSKYKSIDGSCPYQENVKPESQTPRTKFNINDKILDRLETSSDTRCIEMNFEYYSIPLLIESKESNEGTIEISKNAEVGDEVTFNITPKKGYKVDKIIVKDSQGNIIETKDNKFIMPAYNVTIEAIYVVDNPNTMDITLLSLVTIGLISIILLYINKNSKLTKIKEFE